MPSKKAPAKKAANKSAARPKKIPISELSSIKMTAGGERKHSVVIHDKKVKTWVGFGWVTERKATKEDYTKYPEAQ